MNARKTNKRSTREAQAAHPVSKPAEAVQSESETRDRSTVDSAFSERAARLSDWRRRFLTAARLQQRLQLLRAIGLEDRDLAKAVPSVSERSLRRWRSEAAPVRVGEEWDAIDDVCAIVCYFLSDGTFDEDGIVSWLRSRHEQLDHQRPLDLLGAGEFDAVRAAADEDLHLIAAEADELIPIAQPAAIDDDEQLLSQESL